MTARTLISLTWAAALIAAPVLAADFVPPAGCHLELTVQNRGCTLSQHYRCDADPQSHQRSSFFDRSGEIYRAEIDAQTRWIHSEDPKTGISDTLVEASPDHASFDTLIETGRDDFDFWTRSNDGEYLRHVGRDELTGEHIDIDGVALDITSFSLTTSGFDGKTLIQRRGQQFISRSQRRFFGGIETSTDWTGAAQETNDSPVLFSFPDEPGFGSTQPQFDCDLMMTQTPYRKPIL